MNLALKFPPSPVLVGKSCAINARSKILITGATGFVGARLVESLVAQWGCEIFVLVRDYSRAIRLSHLPVKFIYGDLRDAHWRSQLPRPLDYIFHCAYGSFGSRDERAQTDLVGTQNLLAMAAESDTQKFIFLSTVSVFKKKQNGFIDETGRVSPSDAYSKNKVNAENLIHQECKKRKIAYTIFRPAAIIGPGAPTYVSRLINEIKQHEVFFINQGTGKLNWIFVDDVVSAMLNSTGIKKANGKTYILSHPTPSTYFDYYRSLAEIIREPFIYRFVTIGENRQCNRPQKTSAVKIILSAIDPKKLRPLLQFPILGRFIKLFLPLRRFFKPAPRPSINPVLPSAGKSPLPISADYIDFLTSEVIFRSRDINEDGVLTHFTDFNQALEKIKQNIEWESSWCD